jgi:D-alanyl-D-alanine carboxypeptidase
MWAGSSGVTEPGKSARVAPDGWFRIASLTKALTATLVLQLVGEDIIHLGDTVQDWLPGQVPGGREITVRHLLSHTSGLRDYTDDLSDAAVVLRDRLVRRSPAELVASAACRAPLFAPGTSRSYCNTGYILLGMIVEQAAGDSYGAAIKQRILRPAGMRRTLAPSDDTSIPEPHAHGYLISDDEMTDITEFSPSQAWAAGGALSTAEDLNLFYAALLTGRLLAPAQLRLMQETVPSANPGIGAGLGIGRMLLPDGTALWGSTGGFFGFRTWSFHTACADRQLTISATTARGPWPSALDLLTEVFCPQPGSPTGELAAG